MKDKCCYRGYGQKLKIELSPTQRYLFIYLFIYSEVTVEALFICILFRLAPQNITILHKLIVADLIKALSSWFWWIVKVHYRCQKAATGHKTGHVKCVQHPSYFLQLYHWVLSVIL
jgi:hypothetical protein